MLYAKWFLGKNSKLSKEFSFTMSGIQKELNIKTKKGCVQLYDEFSDRQTRAQFHYLMEQYFKHDKCIA